MSKMKLMYVVAGALGVPVVITVLALFLFGFNNGSAPRLAVSAMGLAAFAVIVTMRPKSKVSIVRVAPWVMGFVDLVVAGLALCGIYRMSVACWLVIGTLPVWAAWLQSRFKFPPFGLVVSLGLVVAMLCNCLLLSDATRRSRLLAFARGEELGGRTALAEEQSHWQQTMRNAAWFGATARQAAQSRRPAHAVAQLVDATERHGKWLPLTVCAMFLALSSSLCWPLFGDQYDCSARLFGVMAALWLAAPVFLTVSAAYMLVPAANLPVPFVSCGFETVFAWVVVALVVAGQHAGRERMPVDGVLMPIYGR